MEEQAKRQICKNCRCHAIQPTLVIEPSGVEHMRRDSVCRRYPPTPRRPGDQDSFHTRVDDNNWCAEWTPANPDTVEEAATTLARFVLLGDLTAARALADKLRE